MDELRREGGKPCHIALGVSELDAEVLAFDVPQFAETLDHGFGEGRGAGIDGGKDTELDHPPQRLRLGGERRGEEASTQDGEEGSTLHPRNLHQSGERVD